jgi:hypothetical protein
MLGTQFTMMVHPISGALSRVGSQSHTTAARGPAERLQQELHVPFGAERRYAQKVGRGAAAVVCTVSCLVRTAGHAYCCGGPVQAVVDAGPSRNVAERAVELEWLHGRHSTAALQRRLASQAALRHLGHVLGRLGRPIVNCRQPSVAVVCICALSIPGRMSYGWLWCCDQCCT